MASKSLRLFRLFIFKSFFIAFALTSSSVHAEVYSASAPAGQYSAETVGVVSESVVFVAFMKLSSFAESAQWPTAMHVGIQDGPTRNNSFQVLAIRNSPSDTHLVVGYRLISDGKEKFIRAVENVLISDSVLVQVRYKKGQVELRVNANPPIEISTHLHKGLAYYSVSSGSAVFDITLIDP